MDDELSSQNIANGQTYAELSGIEREAAAAIEAAEAEGADEEELAALEEESAAAVMAILVILGIVHYRKTTRQA